MRKAYGETRLAVNHIPSAWQVVSVYTRRRFLRSCGTAGSLAAASALAGCLGSSDDEAHGFRDDLVDTSETVAPSFLTAYDCDPVTLRDGLGGIDALPSLATDLLANVDEHVTGTTAEDVDRLSGQYGQDGGHDGGDLQFVRPNASQVSMRGSIDADSVAAWLDGHQATTDLGEDRGFRRYGTGGDTPEAFVADGAAFAYGTRQGVASDATTIADATIDALAGDGSDNGNGPGAGGVSAYAPDLLAVADELGDDPFRLATQFDLVAERPDTGVDAYDAVAASVLSAGVGAAVDGTDVRVERVLRYRRDRAPAVGTVEDALERAADEQAVRPLAGAGWNVRRSGRTVTTSTTVDASLVGQNPSALRTAFPIDAFGDVTETIDPRTLGRDAPPRADWRPAMTDDGAIEVVHAGGPAVEDLHVRYERDGETVEAPWEGPVDTDDRFVTDGAPDAGSLFDLVWASGTANETILLRVELTAN